MHNFLAVLVQTSIFGHVHESLCNYVMLQDQTLSESNMVTFIDRERVYMFILETSVKVFTSDCDIQHVGEQE